MSAQDKYIGIMQNMFQKYVAPKYPSKLFNEMSIIGNSGTDDTRITYSFNGVRMSYFGRRTYCLDDYDWFVDKSVDVDGVNILYIEKE